MSSSKTGIDTGLIRELATILQDADLGELEVEHEGLRIRVSRPGTPVQTAVYPAPQQALAAAPAPLMAGPTGGEPAAVAPENAVTSPMVGTVYLSPEPGTKAFVSVGDKVKAGDTVMLVEAMKTFNPVTAPSAGTVRQILVSDAQPVEYGEPLIVID